MTTDILDGAHHRGPGRRRSACSIATSIIVAFSVIVQGLTVGGLISRRLAGARLP